MHKSRSWLRLGFVLILLISSFLFAPTVAHAIAGIEPNSGKQGETLDIAILGADFVEGMEVGFSGPGISVTSVRVVSPTEIVATSAIDEDAPLGPRDVTVTWPDGESYTLRDGFTVIAASAAPTITEVNPSNGEQGETIDISILGTNFAEPVVLDISGEGITVITGDILSQTEIWVRIAIAKDAPPGPRNITVTNPDGQRYTLEEGFFATEAKPPVDVTPPPPITSLTATDAHDDKVDLSWSPSTAVDFYAYMIFVSESEIADVLGMEPAGEITDIGKTSYQVSGLENGVTYYFAVTAVDLAGNEDKAVTGVSVIPTTSRIPAPLLEIVNLTIYPTEAEAGDIVTIGATITNIGDADAIDVRVIFTINIEDVGGKIHSIPIGESVEVSYEWTASEGAHDLGVKVVDFEGATLIAPTEITIDIYPIPAGFPVWPIIVVVVVAIGFLAVVYWAPPWLRKLMTPWLRRVGDSLRSWTGREAVEGKKEYISPEDVPPHQAKGILDFLNSAKTAEEIADAVEIPGGRDVGLKIAQNILEQRGKLGRFTDLKQVDAVPQVGPERFTEIQAKGLLDFLNSAKTAEEIADAVEIPGGRDVGLKIAQNILEQRGKLGRFTDLKQVDAVPQVGPERFTEIVNSLNIKTVEIGREWLKWLRGFLKK